MGKSEDQIPVDFVTEAEKIVHNYMTKRSGAMPVMPLTPRIVPTLIVKTQPIKTKEKRRTNGYFLVFLMILACLAITGVVVFGLLG